MAVWQISALMALSFFSLTGLSLVYHLYSLLLAYWMKSIVRVFDRHIVSYPTPVYLNWSWNWGSLAGLCLALQIVTGILLAMHYTGQVDYAFASVQHIMRDVQNGMILRDSNWMFGSLTA